VLQAILFSGVCAACVSFLVAALFPLAMLDSLPCYYPNGFLSTDKPCLSSGPSFCCAPGYICTDNQLYLGVAIGTQPLNRGSCTDQIRQADACPPFCRTGELAAFDSSLSLNERCLIPVIFSRGGQRLHGRVVRSGGRTKHVLLPGYRQPDLLLH